MIRDEILPCLITLSKDLIPNIRFNVAKSLEVVAPLLKKSHAQVVKDQIKPVLVKLADDADADVKHYGKRALIVVS
jgi:serine/threonine-protein phosphatase 2A regulatory subunit A